VGNALQDQNFIQRGMQMVKLSCDLYINITKIVALWKSSGTYWLSLDNDLKFEISEEDFAKLEMLIDAV
jgi:hypothetical protein